MRVMLVSGSYPPMRCGVGDYTARLASALAELAGTEVAVLTDRRAHVSRCHGQLTILPEVATWNLRGWREALAAVRAWKPDVVHIQFPTQGYGSGWLPWLLPLLLKLQGVPIVQTWHEFMPMKSSRDWALIAGRDRVIVVRPNYREMMPIVYRWFVGSRRIRVIPNASSIPQVDLREPARRAVRSRFVADSKRLVAYFGFAYPHKGVEQLFDILDPQKHHLVLMCDLHADDPYHQQLLALSASAAWAGSVTLTGFLPEEEAGMILASADAVVLPFRHGGGIWNSSLHGAAIQGTFVLTTSTDRYGYVEAENVYYARPDDIPDMRRAVLDHASRRRRADHNYRFATWAKIAEEHMRVYRDLEIRR
ncbi:MAG: hypothetical protein A3J49_18435 [Gallionellales bacterium RIFCSPHIGHO2_02_FULL_57_16]|nr:MAG: hypothetical protein A3J49_18435 [Gallionellales bacterium RIFCSPHIGHO2_02_FULL_57_16]